MPTPLDIQLLRDAKRVGWYLNPHTLKTTLKRCLNCGRPITKSRRRKFCSDNCRYIYNQRLYRERKRLSKLEKPVRGFYGELHIYFSYKGQPTHTIIPALYAQTKEKAMEYVKNHYEGDVKDTIMNQIERFYKK